VKIPDLAAFCRKVAPAVEGRCIRFPGGAKFCIPNLGAGSPLAQLRTALALLSVALVPLQPFFNVLNVLKAIKGCIDAVPELLTDPTKLVQAIADLAKAFGAVIAMFPQVSVPVLIKDILALVAFALRTIAEELQVFVEAAAAIAESAALAESTGLPSLTAEVSCAQDSFDLELANVNASLGPLAELLGAVNLLLGLIGAPEISLDLSSSDDPAQAIEAMLAIAEALEQAADAIPL
jgi:hypothetical protein